MEEILIIYPYGSSLRIHRCAVGVPSDDFEAWAVRSAEQMPHVIVMEIE